MKKFVFTFYKSLLTLVFFLKISDWVLDYSEKTSQLLNTAMFSLIGIAYVVIGFAWDKPVVKTLLVTCGVFLITMNFLEKRVFLEILGIASLLIPILIARFMPTQKPSLK